MPKAIRKVNSNDAPQNVPALDPRYVYGANCTWHGSIHEAKSVGWLPACPHCSGPLFEVQSKSQWDADALKFAARCREPRYPQWLDSLRAGKCKPLNGWDWDADMAKWLEDNPERS